MKIESGDKELVIQSLTQAFATRLIEVDSIVEIDTSIGDSIVINVFAPSERVEIKDSETSETFTGIKLGDEA